MDKAPIHSRVTRWLTVWVVIGSIVMILTERVF